MKTFCEYCHSESLDDSRGNCVNCGAPRKTTVKHEEYLWVTIPNGEKRPCGMMTNTPYVFTRTTDWK